MPPTWTDAAAVLPFLTRARRARVAALLATPRGRAAFVESLCHSHDFDPRFLRRVADDTTSAVAALLRRHGAPDVCYVVSENREIDARVMPLEDALDRVIAASFGTVIGCVPGRVGWYESETTRERFLLLRGPA